MDDGSFDLASTHVHLGRDARALPLEDFAWTPEYLAGYEALASTDGAEGRLVLLSKSDTSWTFWERHPAGDEVVVALSGHLVLLQELDGSIRRVELRSGRATINPTGVWHTADVLQPCELLFITPGLGTEHRPREDDSGSLLR